MKMEFKIKCVWNFLKENGKVYTVRSFLMEDKEVFVEGMGLCKRELIREIYLEDDLFEYLRESGFWDTNMGSRKECVNKWWQTIERFCKGKPKYLYLVVKVE